jgi:hypothetical protein
MIGVDSRVSESSDRIRAFFLGHEDVARTDETFLLEARSVLAADGRNYGPSLKQSLTVARNGSLSSMMSMLAIAVARLPTWPPRAASVLPVRRAFGRLIERRAAPIQAFGRGLAIGAGQQPECGGATVSTYELHDRALLLSRIAGARWRRHCRYSRGYLMPGIALQLAAAAPSLISALGSLTEFPN